MYPDFLAITWRDQILELMRYVRKIEERKERKGRERERIRGPITFSLPGLQFIPNVHR